MSHQKWYDTGVRYTKYFIDPLNNPDIEGPKLHYVTRTMRVLAAIASYLTILWIVLFIPAALYNENKTYSPPLDQKTQDSKRELTALVSKNTVILAGTAWLFSSLGLLTFAAKL